MKLYLYWSWLQNSISSFLRDRFRWNWIDWLAFFACILGPVTFHFFSNTEPMSVTIILIIYGIFLWSVLVYFKYWPIYCATKLKLSELSDEKESRF